MGKDMSDKQMKAILSRNLTQKIRDSGESQANIAAALDISTSSLSSYCTGERFPRSEQLRALADYFNISVGELTDDEATRRRSASYLSQEAASMASLYDELDQYGRSLVRLVLDAEIRRVRDSRHEEK